MLTLPDRFEFQSDAWVDETRRFLEKAVEQRREALAPFSLTERFVDAPPHLQLPDNIGAWNVRYDGTAVTVERGFDPDADVKVEGDYQAGIAGGQFIGMLAPGAAKAMRRELKAMHGEGAVKITGRLENPAAGEIISLLHDISAAARWRTPTSTIAPSARA
jgi:hypothetical protein